MIERGRLRQKEEEREREKRQEKKDWARKPELQKDKKGQIANLAFTDNHSHSAFLTAERQKHSPSIYIALIFPFLSALVILPPSLSPLPPNQ